MNANGQSFERDEHGNDDGRESHQIDPLRMTHGFAVAIGRLPGARAVFECGTGTYGRKKNRAGLHLLEDGGAELIALDASGEERVEGGNWFRESD